MEKLLIIHGLDHDKMGKDSSGAHAVTMGVLNKAMSAVAETISVSLVFYQNNDSTQVCRQIAAAQNQGVQGIVFNPGAWMDSGEDIACALEKCGVPVVEVHMSNIYKQADCHNVIASAVTGLVTGFGEQVYTAGISLLVGFLRSR